MGLISPLRSQFLSFTVLTNSEKHFNAIELGAKGEVGGVPRLFGDGDLI